MISRVPITLSMMKPMNVPVAMLVKRFTARDGADKHAGIDQESDEHDLTAENVTMLDFLDLWEGLDPCLFDFLDDGEPAVRPLI
mmetsp:Transcript_16466/g.37720  ORF Transcript_16466/g.37720 Transcript_16466/m.37720 type:complete len:84 (-) Transcript_16466:912-1163(-)